MPAAATYHDPCVLARFFEDVASPRFILESILEMELKEMAASQKWAHCCGAAVRWRFIDRMFPKKWPACELTRPGKPAPIFWFRVVRAVMPHLTRRWQALASMTCGP